MRQRCDICKNWKPTEYGYGKCKVIQEKTVIDLITGYEGAIVNYIETESDFGCNQFEEIEGTTDV
jgi:hypothetical protein